MEDLFSILPALRRSFPDSDEIREAVVFAVWRKAAGKGLRAHAIPTGLDGKRLTISVRDMTWKRHLESLAPQLLRRLIELLEAPEINFLEFRIDELIDETEPVRVKEPESDSVSGNELPREIVDKAELIVDLELKKQFLEAAASYLRLQRSLTK